MSSIIFSPVMGKIVGQTDFFNLSMIISLGEGKALVKPVKLFLKNDLVLLPDHGRGNGLIPIILRIYTLGFYKILEESP